MTRRTTGRRLAGASRGAAPLTAPAAVRSATVGAGGVTSASLPEEGGVHE